VRPRQVAIIPGARTGVSFAELIALGREQGSPSIVGVHTHPGNSSLSDADGGLLANAPLVAAMVVIGADSTWYVLSAEPGTAPPPKDEIQERYQEVFDLLAPAYGALSYAGSLSEERAWRDLTHDIWDAIAPGLGLRYVRSSNAPSRQRCWRRGSLRAPARRAAENQNGYDGNRQGNQGRNARHRQQA